MIREIEKQALSGIPAAVLLAVLQLAFLALFAVCAVQSMIAGIVIAGLLNAVVVFCWFGLFMVAPNQAKVLQLFGDYVGTVKAPGLRWANPLYSKVGISTRIRNFESDKLKVNDLHGSPIELAAVVVWQVVDTAEASFEVDDYENFVRIQAESALRGLASRYAYDTDDDDQGFALRSHADEVSVQLVTDVQDRLDKAGVKVIEARISHLAYAAEIAGSMLQRQQAAAIVAARRRIVDGAVGLVEMALRQLSEKRVVELDDERRAAMVSNLLVVLCADKAVSPVVNAGSLYN